METFPANWNSPGRDVNLDDNTRWITLPVSGTRVKTRTLGPAASARTWDVWLRDIAVIGEGPRKRLFIHPFTRRLDPRSMAYLMKQPSFNPTRKDVELSNTNEAGWPEVISASIVGENSAWRSKTCNRAGSPPAAMRNLPLGENSIVSKGHWRGWIVYRRRYSFMTEGGQIGGKKRGTYLPNSHDGGLI